MSVLARFPDNTGMGNYLYQRVHGHIIVNLDGRLCVLDTGSALSIGAYPITIKGREFDVHDSYLDVTCDYLSQEIGTDVEGLIGADIISQFTLGIYPDEHRVQFDERPAEGAIVVPIGNFMGVPIVKFACNAKVLPAFFDTGAPLSYLLAEELQGLQPEGVQEEFYPLIGNFLTPVYHLPIKVGGECHTLRFGCLPEELRPMLEAGGVKAILGTELLKHFGMCLSVRDQVLKLDSAINRAAA
jgi:hypothetical protein